LVRLFKVVRVLDPRAVETSAEVKVKLHTFFTTVVQGDEWPATRFGCFASGEIFLPYPLDRKLGSPITDLEPVTKKKISVRNRTPVLELF
jgi:hypothetical protein